MKNNVFIDCGSHFGEGLIDFIVKYNINNNINEWEIHCFEANPTSYQEFLSRNSVLIQQFDIKHYNNAVFTNNEYIKIYEETFPGENNTGQSSSIIGLDKWNPWYDQNKTNECFKTSSDVKCIDFSSFLKHFNDREKVVVKMDIEGSEYDVLEKLISDDTIDIIDDLHIEFHSNYFNNKEEILIRENNIVEKLQSKNIKINNWH